MIKNEGSYEGFKIKIKGFFPLYQPLLKLRTDIQFSTPFCFACYCLQNWSILKKNTSFEILRTSAFMWMYLFSVCVNFYVGSEAFYIFFAVSKKYSFVSDNNFETFITSFIFFQIELPGTLLNTELNELSESAIGFKI